MLTPAFLMCSDPKALEAVSQVLGELEITFETFPDPSLAAKRLANQRFDPILVDCDNPQTARVVLDSIRQSSSNQSSMTIAIVDGKAGVPTAFRLGARLVMTKPVSLEQARSTLRNALAMQRREHDSKVPVGHPNTAASGPTRDIILGQEISESIHAADIPIASLRPSLQPPAQSSPAMTSENIVGQPSGAGASSGLVPSTASARRSAEATSNVVPLKLSRTDRNLSDQDSVEIDDSTATQWEEKTPARRNPGAPSLSSIERPRRKRGPYLLVSLTMLLVAAGCYAAFTMQPAFHDGVVSEYEDLHALISGSAAKTQALVATPRPAPAQPAPAQNSGSMSASPSNAAASTAATPSSAGNAMADGFARAQAAPTLGFKGEVTTAKPASPVLLPASTKAPKAGSETSPVVVAEDVADAHVAYRVRAIYPFAARRKGVEGAVVLQASVNTDGSVDSVRVISGNPQLAPSAVEAVKQWRYEAYYSSGQPVAFQTQITVRFQADAH